MVSALLLLFTAADLSGVWVGQVPRQNNDPLDIAFRFTQQGTALTGKLYDDFKSPPLVEGKIQGEAISFALVVAEQAGNQINEVRYRYTGVVKDGAIELTRERESSRNAGNGGAAPARNNAKQTFTLKRLY